MAQFSSGKKLQSWKAIANFLEHSERTVRRWEMQEGMPIDRHQHISGSRIFAYPAELSIWLSSRKPAVAINSASALHKKPCSAALPFVKISWLSWQR